MNINNLKLFHLMQQNMEWASYRQRTIAQNIANADTPDYVASDVKALDFKKILRQVDNNSVMSLTNPSHLMPALGGGYFGGIKSKNPFEVVPSGNKVVLEDEALKSAQTKDMNDLTMQLYKKFNGMFRMAVRGPNG